ncbi:MAG: hypothetical protein BGP09_03240 [Rhizobium sp. 60-20]|nr:MAG: hypothetical protein BGP09_03240 [Rhizobium sp. 60-20]
MFNSTADGQHIPGPIFIAKSCLKICLRIGVLQVNFARAKTKGCPIIFNHKSAWTKIGFLHIEMNKNMVSRTKVDANLRVPNYRVVTRLRGERSLCQPIHPPKIVSIQKSDIFALRLRYRIIARPRRITKIGLYDAELV